MKIRLIRHAKTEQSALSGKDIDRNLMEKGIAQANVLSLFLAERGVEGQLVWSSAATRTRQTAAILFHAVPTQKLEYFDEFYLCNSEVYLEKITALTDGEELLIIGHNDGISALASYLCGESIYLRTAEYVCIELVVDAWSEVAFGTGTLQEQFRPSVFSPFG
jgi:phosphohistidine phosphatase